MHRKNRFYNAIDGDHFPDAIKGSDLYYSLDLTCWLENESDTLISVNWILSEGITSSDNYINSDKAVIKIATPSVGTYTVTAMVLTDEAGKQQTKPFRYKLRVV